MKEKYKAFVPIRKNQGKSSRRYKTNVEIKSLDGEWFTMKCLQDIVVPLWHLDIRCTRAFKIASFLSDRDIDIGLSGYQIIGKTGLRYIKDGVPEHE